MTKNELEAFEARSDIDAEIVQSPREHHARHRLNKLWTYLVGAIVLGATGAVG